MQNTVELRNESIEFRYMILARLQMDFEYFFGYGGLCEKHLYHNTIDEHLADTKKRWGDLPEEGKPEWFTLDQLNEYERKVREFKASGSK